VLDNSHSRVCSCANCVQWQKDIRAMQREYHASYRTPLKRKILWANFLFYGLAFAWLVVCCFLAVPYLVRWIAGTLGKAF
jgi:hypothetical protein